MNSSEQHVVTLISPARTAGARGIAIVVPPFGKRIVDLTYVALVLQENGFDVVRFDARSHVGKSSGEIEHFTLGSLAYDLTKARDSLSEQAGALILVGISLSSPIALRHAANNVGVDGLVTLAGVVDVPDTIGRIIGTNAASRYLERQPGPEHCEIFGYSVRGHDFAADVLAHGYDGLDATIRDVTAITAPIHIVAARDDELVPVEHVKKVAAHLPQGSSLTIVENSTHEFSRSMTATRLALKALAQGCLKVAGGPDAEPAMPSLTTLIDCHEYEQRLLQELDPAELQPSLA